MHIPVRAARLPSVQHEDRSSGLVRARVDPVPLAERRIVLRVKVRRGLVEAVRLVGGFGDDLGDGCGEGRLRRFGRPACELGAIDAC